MSPGHSRATVSLRLRGLHVLRAAVLAACVCATGCGPSLAHVGYAAPNKVWYHWVVSPQKQTLVVCDVQPDGSETNCHESEI
jgi:hypothetical protein